MRPSRLSAAFCFVALFGLGCWAGAAAIGAVVQPELPEDALCAPAIARGVTRLDAVASAWRTRHLVASIDPTGHAAGCRSRTISTAKPRRAI